MSGKYLRETSTQSQVSYRESENLMKKVEKTFLEKQAFLIKRTQKTSIFLFKFLDCIKNNN